MTSLILSLAMITAVSADSVSTATLNNTASNITANDTTPHAAANTYAAAYQDTQDSGKTARHFWSARRGAQLANR